MYVLRDETHLQRYQAGFGTFQVVYVLAQVKATHTQIS